MPQPLTGALAVLATVTLAAVAQIIMKHQLGRIGPMPADVMDWPRYTFMILTNPGILLGFAMAFLGAMIYLFAISRLPVTYLYPFASISFPAILILGVLVLGEELTWQKAVGSALIVAGVALSAFSDA